MRIPWKKNTNSTTSTGSPTKTATNAISHHSIMGNVGASVTVVDTNDIVDDTMMMMSTTTTTTTPIKPPDSCCGETNGVTASPTSLGSGHYSPIDGSVKKFTPTRLVSITQTSEIHNTSSSSLPVSCIDQTSTRIDDDDSDVYLTPLQSISSTSLDESYREIINKTVPLTVAESTLTEDTTDATIEGEDVKDDVVSEDDPELAAASLIPAAATATAAPNVTTASEPPKFLRHASSFLRVSDLIGLDPAMDLSEHSDKSIPNYHCCSDKPPPGIPHDVMERWIALDDGCYDTETVTSTTTSSYTPIAQFAVDALAMTALATIFDTTMWVPDSKTAKIIDSKAPTAWETRTFQQQNATANVKSLEDHILIWSGIFRHGLYGSDIPAIRSAAIIHMSAEQLLHLLMDSNRVKEYNTMSLGRTDLLTLPCRHIVTKVMRSESRPPLLRKTLQFTSIFHARKLVVDDSTSGDGNNNDNNNSYLLVTRAVANPSVVTNDGATTITTSNNNNNVIVSEILLGVNVIHTIPNSNACLLLSVNHVRSPMVPLYIAKRLGLQAATNFVHDLRKCC